MVRCRLIIRLWARLVVMKSGLTVCAIPLPLPLSAPPARFSLMTLGQAAGRKLIRAAKAVTLAGQLVKAVAPTIILLIPYISTVTVLVKLLPVVAFMKKPCFLAL